MKWTSKEYIANHPHKDREGLLTKEDKTPDEIERFWRIIRQMRYEAGVTIFDGVHFPDFEMGINPRQDDKEVSEYKIDFWNENRPLTLEDVVFQNCTFHGIVNFKKVQFMGDETRFENCTFKKNVNFGAAKFLAKKVIFRRVDFEEARSNALI